MIEFELKCYPKSNCEVNLKIRIGKLAEIAPNQVNYDPETTYGFDITTDRDDSWGYSFQGSTDYFKTQAEAMLRAVAYGNGGFPLESLLR